MIVIQTFLLLYLSYVNLFCLSSGQITPVLVVDKNLDPNPLEVIVDDNENSASGDDNYKLMEAYESFEEREDVVKIGRASPDAVHELVFAVKQLNLDKLESFVNDVSNPDNVDLYGKYKTHQEVGDLTANSQSSQYILDYLNSKFNGRATVTERTIFDEYIRVTAPVSDWEALCNTEFYEFQQQSPSGPGPLTFYCALQYSLPQELTQHVDTVFHAAQFPPQSYLLQTRAAKASARLIDEALEAFGARRRLGDTGDVNKARKRDRDRGISRLLTSSAASTTPNTSTTSVSSTSRPSSTSNTISTSSGATTPTTTSTTITTTTTTSTSTTTTITGSTTPISTTPLTKEIKYFSEPHPHLRHTSTSSSTSSTSATSTSFTSTSSASWSPRSLDGIPSPPKALRLQEGPGGSVTPALINRVYSVGSNRGSPNVSQALYASLGQSFSPSDLGAFQRAFSLGPHPIATDSGGHESDAACVSSLYNCDEANLDTQWMTAISQDTPTSFLYWNASYNGWTTFLTHIASYRQPPLVISISYGAKESSFSAAYMHHFNIVAMKLAAQGVTILAASGDNGANCASGFCGKRSHCTYTPQFPASSPFVTSVGGTMGPEEGSPEVACQSDRGGTITSGGGFSGLFRTPPWQQAAVDQYLATSSPASGFDRAGRGYPDVSLLAKNFEVVLAGGSYLLSGTSASTPVFAAMVSLVNAARVSAGLRSVGWLNPSLYRYGGLFTNDVTDGHNRCTLSGQCCESGFSAGKGWDPVTGLGSVNFTRFREVFLTIGSPGAGKMLVTPPRLVGEGNSSNAVRNAVNSSSVAADYDYSSGWVLSKTYSSSSSESSSSSSSSSCGWESLLLLRARPSGLCLPRYALSNDTLRVVGYKKYSCDRGVPRLSFFSLPGEEGSQDACWESSLNRTVALTSCSPLLTGGVTYSDDVSLAHSFSCSANPDPTALLPRAGNASFAINTQYVDQACGVPSAVQALRQDTCFDLSNLLLLSDSSGGSDSYQSYRLHLPHFFQFTSPACPENSYYYGHYYGDSVQEISLQHCYAPLAYPYGTSTLSNKWSELI